MKKGFTLAEVLIALSVVGVVAVLTVPSLINTYRFRLYSTQLSRAHALLANAVSLVINDEKSDNITEDMNGETLVGFYATQYAYNTLFEGEERTGLQKFYDKYIKGRECSDCLAKKYKTPNGTSLELLPEGAPALICKRTTAEAVICANIIGDIRRDDTNIRNSLVFFVDVNGTKEPNVTGQDMFVMKVNDNGSISDLGESSKCNESGSTVIARATGCFNKYLENGEKVTR